MVVLTFKSVFVLIGMAILAGKSSLFMILFNVEMMPGEALGNQEELKVFEKMDVETWQTLAEFIASKYLFMKMIF